MGVQGLLKSLKPLLINQSTTTKYNIRQFSNHTIAVDASSWLHKAGYACAERLVESTHNRTVDHGCIRIYTNYIIKRCEQLLYGANIESVILVFDGTRCPLKAETNKSREQKRQKNIEEAKRLKSEGRRMEAIEKYKACVKVTDEMAHNVTKAVTSKFGGGGLGEKTRVQCIYSPYEADAQLAQLCLDGSADAIITEDSDIILYSLSSGVPFPIIYKLDRDSGACDVISMSWLLSQTNKSNNSDFYSTILSKTAKSALAGIFRFIALQERRQQGAGCRMFIQACILSGCDYVDSLPGVGLVTAFKMIKENFHKDESLRFRHILMTMRGKFLAVSNQDEKSSNTSNKKSLPPDFSFEDYETALLKSEAAFYYHLVWRRLDKCIDHLTTPYLPSVKDHQKLHLPSRVRFDDLSFLGTEKSAASMSRENKISLQDRSVNSKSHEKSVPKIALGDRQNVKRSSKYAFDQRWPIIETTKRNKTEIVSTGTDVSNSLSSVEDLLSYNPFSKFTLHSKSKLQSDAKVSDNASFDTNKSKNISIDRQPTVNSTATIVTINSSKGPFNHSSKPIKVSTEHVSSRFFTNAHVKQDRSMNSYTHTNVLVDTASKERNIKSESKPLRKKKTSKLDPYWDGDEVLGDNDFDEPVNAITPPFTSRATKSNSVPYVTPFSSSSFMKKMTTPVRMSNKKKKSRYTIMDGFHKQQKMHKSVKKKKSKTPNTDEYVQEKKQNSIRKFFSPLPVRKIFN